MADKKKIAAELRRLAEEAVVFLKAEPDFTSGEVDVRRLLHELQVHQLELEMQNEELQDQQMELELQADELQLANAAKSLLIEQTEDLLNYAESILESAREPMIVLDSELKVLRVNHSFRDTFMVSSEETTGRFIYDLGNRQWDIPQLRLLLEEILPQQKVLNGYEVEHDFPDIGRKTIMLNARQIYRRDIGLDTFILAMEDITERKQLEATAKEALEYAENIVETVREPMLVLDSDLKILSANRSFYETFAVNPKDTIERYLFDLGNGQWNIPSLRTLLDDILGGCQASCRLGRNFIMCGGAGFSLPPLIQG